MQAGLSLIEAQGAVALMFPSSLLILLAGNSDSQQRLLERLMSWARTPVVLMPSGRVGSLRPVPIPFTRSFALPPVPPRSRIPFMPSCVAAASLYLKPLLPAALHNVALAGTSASKSKVGAPLVSAKTQRS